MRGEFRQPVTIFPRGGAIAEKRITAPSFLTHAVFLTVSRDFNYTHLRVTRVDRATASTKRVILNLDDVLKNCKYVWRVFERMNL